MKWKRVIKAAGCAKQSFRVKKVGPRKSVAFLRFCCPKGKWKSGYCTVGMKLQAVGVKRRR